jgi:hypothetical protein
MSLIGETVDTVEKYPWWIAGGVAALLALWWWLSPSGTAKGNGTPPNFQFSYGPSDANVAAGTQLAIQQGHDQTQMSMATLNAQTQGQAAGDYYGYLTTNSANNKDIQLASLDAQGKVAPLQIAANLTAASYTRDVNLAAIAAGTTQNADHDATLKAMADIQAQIAAITTRGTVDVAAIQGATTSNVAASNALAQSYVADPLVAAVGSAYQKALGRQPDAAGLAYWVNQITVGGANTTNLVAELQAGAIGMGDISYVQAHPGG